MAMLEISEACERDALQTLTADDPPAEASGTLPRNRPAASKPLLILTVLGVFYSMYFARAVLVPVGFAIMIALLFRPVVRRARRMRIPTPISSAVLLLATILSIAAGIAYVMAPAREWVNNAPRRLHEVGAKLHVVREQLQQIDEASETVQQLAEGEDDPPTDSTAATLTADQDQGADAAEGQRAHSYSLATAAEVESVPEEPRTQAVDAEPAQAETPPAAIPRKPVPVEVKQPRLVTGLAFLSSTGGLLAEILVTLVLAFFLLSSGDTLINNFLRVLPSFRDKRNAVELVRCVEAGVSNYLLTVCTINICLGVVIGVAMAVMGLPNPILWGVMATLLNFVPYLGALVGACVIFVVAVLTFDSVAVAVLVPAMYLTITSIEGNLVTPHVLGRSMSLNPIMVFLSLTFWGWMWGLGGAVLAVPILAVMKVSFDSLESTRHIGTLLGGPAVRG